MQFKELESGLRQKFTDNRIVFWHDPEQRFIDSLNELDLDDVSLLDMRGVSVLATKKRIEIDEPTQKFLLYFTSDVPAREQDWLLDIRLYSTEFHADYASITLNSLGIPQLGLREHVQLRKAFFTVKRTQLLKGWVTERETEKSLDKKMLAVVAGASTFETKEILFALIQQFVAASQQDDSALENTFAVLKKLGLDKVLWEVLSLELGYQAEVPTLENLLLKLFCTDLWAQGDDDHREWLSKNVLTTAAGRASALAFMGAWRNDRRYKAEYDYCAADLQQTLQPKEHYNHSSPYALAKCDTFEAIEQLIIRGLVTQLQEESTTLDRDAFKALVSERSAKYWSQTRPEYLAIWNALRQAERLLNLRNHYTDGFNFPDTSAFWKAYCNEIYRFDQTYRLFNEYAAPVHSKGAMILHELDKFIEELYSNWYLAELSRGWNKLLETENRMQTWQISDVPLQRNFYKDNVKRQFDTSQVKRVFVVISDALRYEVAEELGRHINHEKHFSAELRSQTGVLPSYTQLGMAALLPHESLSYLPDNSGVVYADGMSTSGFEKRAAILAKVNGVALKAKDLQNANNQEVNDQIRNASVVYIWHDTIDAIGDKAATEDKTFEACRSAITELKDLVSRLRNRFNASRIFVTADHGFLFQQQALVEQDKTKLESKAVNAIEANKRFIIGHQLPESEFCWHGKLADTAGASDESEFLLPKGVQRFHFVGGARFVHGGAMLQEVCVPVLKIRALEKKAAEKQPQRQPVSVVARDHVIKLVNSIDKIGFIQTTAVDDLNEPRTLNIFIVDENNQVVSGMETVCFDSDNDDMGKRTRDVTMKLMGTAFNRKNKYVLILENADSATEYGRYPITIDLAFQDDFF
ncbi:TPA: BREX-1 system phosphatase PglZ type A [Yersinia enterocolitica]